MAVTPLAPFASWAIRIGAYAAAYWLTHGHPGLFSDEHDVTTFEGRRFELQFEREAPTGLREDAATFNIVMVNITDGTEDSTWTTTDYLTVIDALNAYITAIKGEFSADFTYTGVRAYRIGPGVFAPNPAEYVYVHPTGIAMTGGDGAPFQVACTTTLRTAAPKHWGRWYLPTPAKANMENGRYASTFVDFVATSGSTLINALSDDDFLVSVYSPAGQTFMGVTSVECDDVPDIVRRRRAKQTGYRKILSA